MKLNVLFTLGLGISILLGGCVPAEPLEVSAVKIVVGESGTVYFNQAQRDVTRGEVLEISLELPTDVHFFNGSAWWSVEVENSTTLFFGPKLDTFASIGAKTVSVAGADAALALCDGALYRANSIDGNSNELDLDVPGNETCTVYGFELDGGYPKRVDERTIRTDEVSRVVFQPQALFDQDLGIQVADAPTGHVSTWLTIGGVLTSIPLGEGIVSKQTALVVLSPPDIMDFGVWAQVSELSFYGQRKRKSMGVHLGHDVDQARIEWPTLNDVSPMPDQFGGRMSWLGSLSNRDVGDNVHLRATLLPLTANDSSAWQVDMPMRSSVTFPIRPFEPEGFFENLKAVFTLVKSDVKARAMPQAGTPVSARVEAIEYDGYYRSVGCQGRDLHYGLWNVIDTCDNEQPYEAILWNSCGELVPEAPISGFSGGRFEDDVFVRSSGARAAVDLQANGEIRVGIGADAFLLRPARAAERPLPTTFQTIRGGVTVSEQIFEYTEGNVGLALEEPRVIYASPWRALPSYQGLGTNYVYIRAGQFAFDAVVDPADDNESGLPLKRVLPLCADYEEWLILRQTMTNQLILEQHLSKTGMRTLIKRIYYFGPP